MARGRPTEYTEEIAAEICERLSEGESLRSICRDDHMPAESTVRVWAVDDRGGFFAQYTRARDIGLDCRADKIREDIEGESDTQRARLLFDHDRWYLSKLAPKKYGDRSEVDVTSGGKPLPPIQVHVINRPQDGSG